MSRRAAARTGLALVAAVAVGAAVVGLGTRLADNPSARGAAPTTSARSRPDSRTGHPVIRRARVLGRSVRGRAIVAVHVGDPHDSDPVLVVGCIHGNEGAGIAVARDLATDHPPRSENVWVVLDLNPDGHAAGTRQNADGVDLNRNFPLGWRPIAAPGDLHYSGPRALSEPESRLAVSLIRRIRPSVSVWFHQHVDVVDRSGGRAAVERRYARLVGLPFVRLPRYPASV